MKRVALFVVCMLPLLSSCAHATGHYTVKSVTGTIPLFDDFQTNCSLPPNLLPVHASVVRKVRITYTQNSVVVKADSVSQSSGTSFIFPSFEVFNSAAVSVVAFLVDSGGTSCPSTLSLVPVVQWVAPAKVTLTIVP